MLTSGCWAARLGCSHQLWLTVPGPAACLCPERRQWWSGFSPLLLCGSGIITEDSACLTLAARGSLKKRTFILFVYFSSTVLVLGLHTVLADCCTACFSSPYALALGLKSSSSFFLDTVTMGLCMSVLFTVARAGRLSRAQTSILLFNIVLLSLDKI